MKFLIENFPEYSGTAIDLTFYGKGNQYSIYPMLFKQNNHFTNDVEHTDLKQFDKILTPLVYYFDQHLYLNGILEKVNRHFKTTILFLTILFAFFIYVKFLKK